MRKGRVLWQVALLAGVLWMLTLSRLAFLWHAQYRQTLLALATIEETHQVHSPTLKAHLLNMAAQLLGVSHAPQGLSQETKDLNAAALTTLHHLATSQWLVAPALWVVGVAVMAVALYWMKEGRIAHLEAEHRRLKDQLLAIARGWSSLGTASNPETAMHSILREVSQHTVVRRAAIYRLTGDRVESLHLYASHGKLALSTRPVPAMFLEPERGLLGEALGSNQPRYSGDDGSMGYLFPGVRLERVAVFPLRYQEQPWGILLLQADQNGWFSTYRDLLEVLAQEIAIVAATADALEQERIHRLREERAHMQAEILANVSHELRTPLGLVKGYLETLQRAGERLPVETQHEFLSVAVQETGELETLIEQLLTMSQWDNAEWPFEPRWFPLSPWLSQILDRYPVWERERIQVRGGDRLSHLYGDPQALTTAVSDLLQNALKYSSREVRLTFAELSEGWMVDVRDFGPGVPSADVDKIFERFYRSPQHAKSAIRGSGLGLAIVKRVAETHGGKVRADNLGEPPGFRVVLTLPWGEEGHDGGAKRLSVGH